MAIRSINTERIQSPIARHLPIEPIKSLVFVCQYETSLVCGLASELRLKSVETLANETEGPFEEDGYLQGFCYGTAREMAATFPEISDDNTMAQILRVGLDLQVIVPRETYPNPFEEDEDNE